MKKLTMPVFVLLALLTLVSACKKDDDNNNNNNNNNNSNPLSQALGGSPAIPSGAAGALYAVNNYVESYDEDGALQIDQIGTAYAWFDSYTSTKDAGTVSCNTYDLDNNLLGSALPWYYTLNGYLDFSSTNTAQWSVAGNSSTGVTGFNYTDNTTFPKCSFSVPSAISRNSALTITNTNIGSNDAVFYTLYTQGSQKINKAMPANSTSVTFTAAEIQSVAPVSGTQIGVQVMPVKIKDVSLNGKTYYFVKQWAYGKIITAN